MLAGGGARVTRVPNDFTVNAAETSQQPLKKPLVIASSSSPESWAVALFFGGLVVVFILKLIRSAARLLGLRWS